MDKKLMKTKHTPGPWNNDQDGFFIEAADGTPIARTDVHPAYLPGERKHEHADNTLLICAAPDMFAALNLVLAYWKTPDVQIDIKIMEQVVMAVKKAGG